MNHLVETGILAGIALFGLLTVGLVFSRLYRRSSKELAFVPRQKSWPSSARAWVGKKW